MELVTPVAVMLKIPVTVIKKAQPMGRGIIFRSFKPDIISEGCSPSSGATGKYNKDAMNNPNIPSIPISNVGEKSTSYINGSSLRSVKIGIMG